MNIKSIQNKAFLKQRFFDIIVVKFVSCVCLQASGPLGWTDKTFGSYKVKHSKPLESHYKGWF